MFQFSTAHWCERKIGAASGQAGPEVWPSRTHVQNGKRLAAYGDLSSNETKTKAGNVGSAGHKKDGDPMTLRRLPLAIHKSFPDCPLSSQ